MVRQCGGHQRRFLFNFWPFWGVFGHFDQLSIIKSLLNWSRIFYSSTGNISWKFKMEAKSIKMATFSETLILAVKLHSQVHLGLKKFWVKKFLIPKKFLVKKNWGTTNFGSKKFWGQQKSKLKKSWLQKILGKKKLGSKKIFDPKKFLVQKNWPVLTFLS